MSIGSTVLCDKRRGGCRDAIETTCLLFCDAPAPVSLLDGHVLYMGKDKYENEDLIRYGFPEDVWFHVDNLSSAHVYLRMNRGEKVP